MIEQRDLMLMGEKIVMAETHNKQIYDGVVLICSDGDYLEANRAFYNRLGMSRVDEVKLVGGPKNLADPSKPQRLELALDDLGKLIELHGQSPNYPVFLMWHRQCATYNFQDSEELYRQHMQKALEIASQLSRPLNLIVSEVVERDDDQKPKKVSFHKYDIKAGTLEKSHLFTYQKD